MVTANDYNLDEIRAVMEANNIRRLRAEFSGGGDQGGIDTAKMTMADGTEKSLEYTYPFEYKQVNGKFREIKTLVDPDDAEMNRIWEMIAGPISEEYGSWAGEFYTSGEVIIDLDAEPEDQLIVEDNYTEDIYDDDEDWDDETDAEPADDAADSELVRPATGEQPAGSQPGQQPDSALV